MSWNATVCGETREQEGANDQRYAFQAFIDGAKGAAPIMMNAMTMRAELVVADAGVD